MAFVVLGKTGGRPFHHGFCRPNCFPGPPIAGSVRKKYLEPSGRFGTGPETKRSRIPSHLCYPDVSLFILDLDAAYRAEDGAAASSEVEAAPEHGAPSLRSTKKASNVLGVPIARDRYFPRVQLNGDYGPIKRISGVTARAMVDAGIARVEHTRGRISQIVLTGPPTHYSQRIGAASAPSIGGVKFTRYARLDNVSTRVIEHHPRCTW